MKLARIAVSLSAVVGLMTACSASGVAGSDAEELSDSSPIAAGTDVPWAPAGPLIADGQRSGDLMVWLASSPNPLVQGDAQLEAFLSSSDGEPVTGATVAYDIDMTNMSHGTYVVPARAADEGYYVGRVHLMMPGPWRVIITIDRPEQQPVRLRFEFRVMS